MAHDKIDREAFGLRLARARKEAGYTLEAVGEHLSAHGWPSSKQTVSAWEKGRNLPDPLVLRKLCHLYQTSADSLIWHADGEVPGSAPVLDTKILQQLRKLSADQRASVEMQLRATFDLLKMSPVETDEAPETASRKPRRAA